MSRIHALERILVAVLLLAAIDASAQDAAADMQDRAVILAVTVNGLAGDAGAVFLEDEAGHLHAPAAFLSTWNLRPGVSSKPGDSAGIAASSAPEALSDANRRESRYFDLTTLPGLSYQWNHETAELIISAAPEAFLSTRINIGGGLVPKPAPYAPGAYLNYDLSTTRGPAGGNTAGLFDAALFRGEGLLTSSFVAGTAATARLMTTWQTDKFDAIKTLRIGDSFNHTGTWGRGVLFGGIQYGTNFAVRPDFVPFATPGVTGRALLPSTVDVYVNRVLRSRQAVNAGPFSIQNLPVITGAGEVQVVVKDVLGREQLITQSFFASPVLLREGLVDEAYELGWLRENYGLSSNDYSDPFITATWRKGLNSRFTGEARVEVQQQAATAGFSAATKLAGSSSVVESSFAFSSASGLSPGRMAGLSYSYQGARWSGNVRAQLNSTSFRQLGSDPANLPKQYATAQLSMPVWNGTLSANYLRNLVQGQSVTRLINLSYSTAINDSMFANFSLVKPLSNASGGGTVVSLGVTILFDRTHVGSTTMNTQSGSTSLYSDFQKAVPQGEGTGYRFAALNGGATRREEASVMRNQSYAAMQADVVSLNDDVSMRLSAQGGIATLGNGVFLSRGLDQGFAIVQTHDMPGVPVYVENQLVGHTDRSGRVVVNNLRAYQPNRISIDPATLPMEASVGEVVQTVVPRSRGGVIVDFAVRRVRSATLTIMQADGTELPPWTPVEVVGMTETYVSGNRGEVFVDLPNPTGNRIIARPEGGPVCELSVDQPEPGSTAPFLEPLICATGK